MQLFFFKGSAGSWTVCRIVALTACDINAVSFDLIVSGNFFYLFIFYSGGTAVKFNTFIMKPGLSGSHTNTHANTHTLLVPFASLLFCQHHIADEQLASLTFAIVLICHLCSTYSMMNILPLVSPEVDANEACRE